MLAPSCTFVGIVIGTSLSSFSDLSCPSDTMGPLILLRLLCFHCNTGWRILHVLWSLPDLVAFVCFIATDRLRLGTKRTVNNLRRLFCGKLYGGNAELYNPSHKGIIVCFITFHLASSSRPFPLTDFSMAKEFSPNHRK